MFILNDEPACSVMRDHFADFISSRGSRLQTQLHLEGLTGEMGVISSAVSVPQVCDIMERIRASEKYHLSVYLVMYVILYKSKCVHSKKKKNTPKRQISLQSNGSA